MLLAQPNLFAPNVLQPNGASSAGSVQVGSATTTTSLSASPTTITYGASVTLTATVSPSGATGTVTFYDGVTVLGSAVVNSGTVTLSVTSISAGSRSITATYSGSAAYASSSSSAVTVTVNKASTTTSLVASPNPAAYGQLVTLTATVSGSSSTGTVTFYDGANALGSAGIRSGQALLKTAQLAAGSHSLTATYSGDSNYNTSTSSAVTETINAATTQLQLVCSRPGTSADYVRYLYAKPVKTDRINEPDYLDLQMVPWDNTFVTLKRGDYLTFYNATFGTWFTGYVTNDAEIEKLGSKNGQPVFGYKYQLTSDEYVLNLKPIGLLQPYLNMTQGEILKSLVTALAPNTTFDVSNIHDGLTLARYVPDPTKKFSDIVQEFCDSAGYRWQARNQALYFEQMDTRVAALTIDGNDKHFTPSNLSITNSKDQIINDAIVLGDLEPTNYMSEYFVSDAVTTNFKLISSLWGADNSVLLDDDFKGSTIDDTKWFVYDDPQNFIQLYNGYVNALGGPNDNSFSVYLESAALIPLDGIIRITHGEWDIVSYSDGVICGLWSKPPDGSAGLSSALVNCVYGIRVSKSTDGKTTILNPIVMGVVDSTQSYSVTDYTRTYVIRTNYQFNTWGRFQQGYSYMDDNGSVWLVGGTGQAGTASFATWISVIKQGDQAPSEFVSWQNLNVVVPDNVLYANYNPMVLNDLHATFSGCTVANPLQATLEENLFISSYGTNGGYAGFVPRIIGPNDMDSFDGQQPAATIVDANQGASTRSSTLGRRQYNPGNATLGYIVDPASQKASLPPSRSIIRVKYRRADMAMARVQDSTSIASEASAWGDNGLRSVTRRDLTPLPRTSADCELAAQAIVGDYGRQHWDGTYTGTNLYSFTGEPLSGTVLKFQNLPTDYPSSLTAEVIQEVKTTFLCNSPQEIFQHQVKFGRKDLLKKIAAKLTKKQEDVFNPQDTVELPAAVGLDAVGLVFAPDVSSPTLDHWDPDYLYFNTNQAPPSGGGFEVRYTDSSWGADDGRNLVTRTSGQTFTVPRNLRGKVAFVRAYDQRNFLLYSEDLTQSQWTKTSATISRTSSYDINGSWSLISTATISAGGSISQAATGTNALSAEGVFSVDLKGVIAGQVQLIVKDANTSTQLTSETIALTTTWQRLSLGIPATNGVGGPFVVYIVNPGAQSVQVMVHRASLEVSTSTETVYCKTNSTTYGALSRYAAGIHVAFPLAPPTPVATIDTTNLTAPILNLPFDQSSGSGAIADVWGYEVRDASNTTVLAHEDISSPAATNSVQIPSNRSRTILLYVYFYNILGEYGQPQTLTTVIPYPAVQNLQVDDSQKKVLWQGINGDSFLVEVAQDSNFAVIDTAHTVTDQFFSLSDTDFFNQRWIKVTPYDSLGPGDPQVISHVYVPPSVIEFGATEVSNVAAPPNVSTDPTVPTTVASQAYTDYINESWKVYALNKERVFS